MTAEQLGELGESSLRLMAAEGNFVSNPASRDLGGFDSIVELQFTATAPAPDLMPQGHRAFIQVKATQGEKKSIGIKLSNWQKMVNDPSPWFVLVLRVSLHRKIQEALLVHIDTRRIERALKALRLAKKPLHKMKLSISYGDEDRLPECSGTDLRQRLLETIGSDVWAYQEKKRHVFTTCGYETYRYRAKFVLRDKPHADHVREWTNAALGEGNPIEIETAKIFNRRFGSAVEVRTIEGGHLKLKPPGMKASIEVSGRGDRDWVSVPATVYSTTTIPHIPIEDGKMRITAGPLNIYASLFGEDRGNSTSMSASVSWDFECKQAISLVAAASKGMRLLSEGHTRLILTLGEEVPRQPFKLGISGLSPLGKKHRSEFDELEHAGDVASRVGLQGVEVTADDLLSQRPRFTLLHRLAIGEAGDLSLAIPAPDHELRGDCALIFTPFVRIGEWVVVACAALIARPRKNRNELIFKDVRVRLHGLWPVRVAETATFPLQSKVDELATQLGTTSGLNVIKPERLPLGLASAHKDRGLVAENDAVE